MGQSITAILIRDAFDEAAAQRFDLRPVALEQGITLFHIDHYYSGYWQSVLRTPGRLDVPRRHLENLFPSEPALRTIVSSVTGQAQPVFAIIRTEYFGGFGDQWACAYEGERRVTGDEARINEALALLGVERRDRLDEFDSVGLRGRRQTPEYLERYQELCDEAGV